MTHLTKFLRATLCLIGMLGVNVAFAQSESITICDGTDENRYVPFYFYYLDNIKLCINGPEPMPKSRPSARASDM